ncbi:MAG: hypothetical protein J7K58_04935 [Euryarchaeota archaeon]|nr:hypothetical protein [Euryarchaeota archaeon]
MKEYANQSINLLRIGLIFLTISLTILLVSYVTTEYMIHEGTPIKIQGDVSIIKEGINELQDAERDINYFKPISEPSL